VLRSRQSRLNRSIFDSARMGVSYLLIFILPTFISRLTRALARSVCLRRYLQFAANWTFYYNTTHAFEIESRSRFRHPFSTSAFRNSVQGVEFIPEASYFRAFLRVDSTNCRLFRIFIEEDYLATN